MKKLHIAFNDDAYNTDQTHFVGISALLACPWRLYYRNRYPNVKLVARPASSLLGIIIDHSRAWIFANCEYLCGDQFQWQTDREVLALQGNIAGLSVRGTPDAYSPQEGIILEFKVTQSRNFERGVYFQRAQEQLAAYRFLMRETHPESPINKLWLFVYHISRDNSAAFVLYEFDEAEMDAAMSRVIRRAENVVQGRRANWEPRTELMCGNCECAAVCDWLRHKKENYLSYLPLHINNIPPELLRWLQQVAQPLGFAKYNRRNRHWIIALDPPQKEIASTIDLNE